MRHIAVVPTPSSTRRAKGGDFQMATSGDLNLAASGDFYMATDTPFAC